MIAWLLREPGAERVAEAFRKADLVFASDLTILDCERVLIRAMTFGEISETNAVDRQSELHALAANWNILPISSDVLHRARRPLPAEPIRTLDAIHLASALAARSLSSVVELLSLDNRIRASARQLGLKLQP